MDLITAIHIDTHLWYRIIEFLKSENWILTKEYTQFDKEVDFDFYAFKHKNEMILCAWDNWFEGEIQCNKQQLRYIENQLNTTLEIGKPEHLDPDILNKIDSLLTKYNM